MQMNEFDHHILALRKQQREGPEKWASNTLSVLSGLNLFRPFVLLLKEARSRNFRQFQH